MTAKNHVIGWAAGSRNDKSSLSEIIMLSALLIRTTRIFSPSFKIGMRYPEKSGARVSFNGIDTIL